MAQNIKRGLFIIFLPVILYSFGSHWMGQSEYAGLSSDTLTARVIEWRKLKPGKQKEGVSRQVLRGATRDLSMLDIQAFTLNTGQAAHITGRHLNADALVIVKEGSLSIAEPDTAVVRDTLFPKVLGPGGVALFPAAEQPIFINTGSDAVTYYIFYFQSRWPKDSIRARRGGGPFLIDWGEMTMKKTDKGESRPIFSRPVAWLEKIDMHATTLNAGEVSHAPHVHRNEEIILLRSGNVQMYIDGRHYKASGGDLVFLSSGVPHALENTGKGRCEYFALQWQQ